VEVVALAAIVVSVVTMILGYFALKETVTKKQFTLLKDKRLVVKISVCMVLWILSIVFGLYVWTMRE